MPRKGRLHIPGGYYHVMGRGLERRSIFRHEADKQDFLERLGTGLGDTGCRCYAWAIMPNHYHLLLQVADTPLTRLMHGLLTGFAVDYNRRHSRCGYVFQNRFKSILCEAEPYFLTLLRYIHLNPLTARLVPDLSTLHHYPWTGHSVVMGHCSRDWQETRAVLQQFSLCPETARLMYCAFLQARLESGDAQQVPTGNLIRGATGWESAQVCRAEHERRIGDERILGREGFIRRVLQEDTLDRSRERQMPGNHMTLDALLGQICGYYAITAEDLLAKGRNNTVSHARSLLCYLGYHRAGIAMHVLAQRLAISRVAVSRAVRRGKVIYERDSEGIDARLS